MDGARFERDVAAAFRDAGIKCIHPRQDRPVDVGDLWVASDVVVQAKAWQNLPKAIREGIAGSQAQKKRAHRPIGVAVAKRVGENVLDSIVAMPLRDLILLLQSRDTPDQ
ncbi:holliday junction resolvase [Microbacterium phage Eden]|uniref:Holliday junction resolvase n=1 Tax=Microbacterium phage Eden TaxID=2250289 RepID=A0A345KWC8_9CAUD|nr:holliday junction resolvase [Microbacterium phage Eden]AXH47330.1 holliday junction resolvase [Microbacterium phage Eden]